MGNTVEAAFQTKRIKKDQGSQRPKQGNEYKFTSHPSPIPSSPLHPLLCCHNNSNNEPTTTQSTPFFTSPGVMDYNMSLQMK